MSIFLPHDIEGPSGFNEETAETTAAASPDRPVVRFTCKEKDEEEMFYFPSPPSISFSGVGSYGSIDQSVSSGLQDAIAGLPLIGKISGNLQAAGKVVANPHTNTTFTANGVRNSTFTFKLMPQSADESNDVKKVIEYCNRMVYAKPAPSKLVGSMVLQYPPLWHIDFLAGGEDNPYVQSIFESYLTNFQVVYNSDGNAYYNNNAPLDIELQFSFQEARVLNRSDIEHLQTPGKRGDNDDSLVSSVAKELPAVSDVSSGIAAAKKVAVDATTTKGGTSLFGKVTGALSRWTK